VLRSESDRMGDLIAVILRLALADTAQRPKTAKLVSNDRLRTYVQDRLSGAVRAPQGSRAGARCTRRGRVAKPRSKLGPLPEAVTS